MNKAQIAVLKTELAEAGYSAMSDAVAKEAMNVVNISFTNQFLSGSDIFNATDDAEYNGLTVEQKSSWDALCAISSIDTSNGVAKAREAELFGVGTTTRANLIAARQTTISRATELGLPRVRTGHIQEARA